MPTPNDVIAAVQSADQAKLAQLLAENPALASARDTTGVSAIMHAIYRHSQEGLQALLATHPELDIFEAASVGDTARLSVLLATNPDLVNSFSADGFTALHFAAFFTQEAAARMLIERGANVSAVAKNPTQVMPLHSAASSRDLAVARMLLEHGAPPNAKQQQGWTPLHACAQNGDKAIAELLLKHGVDPRIPNDNGVTPEQLAREKGFNDVAAILAAA